MSYNPDNILAKILRQEIPADVVYESPHSLAIRDIAPQAPVHVLVIPKGAYVSYDAMIDQASEAELLDFQRAIAEVINHEGLRAGGYRLIMNNGRDGGQEVPHLHCHVLGKRPLGAILAS